MATLACFACSLRLYCPVGACRQRGCHHSVGGAARSAGTHRQVADADIQVLRRWVGCQQVRLCFLQPAQANVQSAQARNGTWLVPGRQAAATQNASHARLASHSRTAVGSAAGRSPPAKTAQPPCLAIAMQVRQPPPALLPWPVLRWCWGSCQRAMCCCVMPGGSDAAVLEGAEGGPQPVRRLLAVQQRHLLGLRRWPQAAQAPGAGAPAAAGPLDQRTGGRWLQGGEAAAQVLPRRRLAGADVGACAAAARRCRVLPQPPVLRPQQPTLSA